MQINSVLFDGFTMLDAFGAADVLSRLPDTKISYFSLSGGVVASSTDTRILTSDLGEIRACDILLRPGGMGARSAVCDERFIAALKSLCKTHKFTLTVCTGSTLLSLTGELDGKIATTNKAAWRWATSLNPRVKWRRKARWTRDGGIYTSSGVCAGIDAAFGLARDIAPEAADEIASAMEYKPLGTDDDEFC